MELHLDFGILRDRLKRQSLPIGDTQSQIIPIVVGDPERATAASQALRDLGFFVPGIRPPTVPVGESLLRISVCYGHDLEAIDGLVDALHQTLKN